MSSSKNSGDAFKPFTKNSIPRSLVPESAVISEVVPPNLTKDNKPTYSKIKAEFKQDLILKSQSFALSQLVADQMAVESEEKHRFERRVAAEVMTAIEKLRADAEARGEERGLQLGMEKAYNEEKAKLAALMEKFVTAIASIDRAKKSLTLDFEKQLLDLAFSISEAILHKEIKERPEEIASTIRSILDRISDMATIKIKLSPHEFSVVEKIQNDVAAYRGRGRIEFEEDSNLQPGDCVVTSEEGDISLFIALALERLKKFMTNKQDIVKRSGTHE